MSLVGAIFVPFPSKTGTNMLHPLPPQSLNLSFDGCSRKALRAAHREMGTVKMRLDEDPDDFLYKKNRCRDRLNSVTPKEGPSDGECGDIIL